MVAKARLDASGATCSWADAWAPRRRSTCCLRERPPPRSLSTPRVPATGDPGTDPHADCDDIQQNQDGKDEEDDAMVVQGWW